MEQRACCHRRSLNLQPRAKRGPQDEETEPAYPRYPDSSKTFPKRPQLDPREGFSTVSRNGRRQKTGTRVSLFHWLGRERSPSLAGRRGRGSTFRKSLASSSVGADTGLSSTSSKSLRPFSHETDDSMNYKQHMNPNMTEVSVSAKIGLRTLTNTVTTSTNESRVALPGPDSRATSMPSIDTQDFEGHRWQSITGDTRDENLQEQSSHLSQPTLIESVYSVDVYLNLDVHGPISRAFPANGLDPNEDPDFTGITSKIKWAAEISPKMFLRDHFRAMGLKWNKFRRWTKQWAGRDSSHKEYQQIMTIWTLSSYSRALK